MSDNLKIINAIVQFAGGTQAEWDGIDKPVPDRALIVAMDTGVVKRGDGVTLYANLPTLFNIQEFTTWMVTLLNKADINHVHAIADITGLTAALAGKAALSHTHTLAQLPEVADALAQIYVSVNNILAASVSPAANHTLPSAWGSDGVPSAYTLTNALGMEIYAPITDTDKGAWVKKVAGTAWALETLNTATRGARAEFPATAGIVGQSNLLVVYDLDALDSTGAPALWKSWVVSGLTSISAGQGRIIYGTATGLYVINLIADTVTRYDAVGQYRARQSATTYNQTTVTWTQISSTALADNVIVHSRMTVRPLAPRDPYGVEIPTYLVSTNAGLQAIGPLGTVSTVTVTNGYNKLRILPGGRVMAMRAGTDIVEVGPIPSNSGSVANTVWRHALYSSIASSTSSALRFIGSGTPIAIDPLAIVGSDTGISLLHENWGDASRGMVSHVGIDFATGWLVGDIRLAALCDTTVGNITGSGELVVNGNFAGDLTGWADLSTAPATAVWSSGTASLTGDGTNSAKLRQNLSVASGVPHIMTITVFDNPVTLTLGSTVGGTEIYNNTALPVGVWAIQFTSQSSIVSINVSRRSTGAGRVDNISVQPGSFNRAGARGLTVTGTLSRTLVTGDLAMWGGWSAVNYLQQPYVAEQDAGTASWYDCVEVVSTATAAECLLSRDSSTTGARRQLFITASGVAQYIVSDGSNTVTVTSTHPIADGLRHTVAGVVWREAGIIAIITDGVLSGSANIGSLGSLSNATATLRLGVDQRGASAATTTKLALLRCGATAPTYAQWEKIAADEKIARAGNMTLVGPNGTGTSVSSDPISKIVTVANDQGLVQFGGLRRLGQLTHTNTPALDVNTAKKVVSFGGRTLVSTDSAVGLVATARSSRDDIRQAVDPIDVAVSTAITTDATPTVAARYALANGADTFLNIKVISRETGQTGVESASFEYSVRVKRPANGNIALVGSTYSVVVERTTSTLEAAVTVDTVTQSVVVTVTGKASIRMSHVVSVKALNFEVQ